MFEPIKHNMETIAGVAIYPILSLLIFFLFFVALGAWVFTYKKEKIDQLSQMPLQETNSDPFNI
ncbi:CcoQ/FixQ family Cbb3-type cytochrome c oxidase assembly chaperone [Flavobacterium sp. CYK-4]|jgi:cytochrome c oxidase cbb3-type subunit IV|uniref:CcoQ/FixQ family Cbb3-type cytochrome c oxidase assembly chaperone n=1 Tax=Flavobacterium lotistagni TaxID=2709660 RepID=UPI00140D15D4|nr:CcoQ/FixQ family Cbb3-type cytochrome c oxidase assembly chaperone [Flavobacterium lotistagni]NHM07538.1 CcoQ/FixQ family Cbb3-type cytochrome c oxidase assembly chaperone [Flavobacterium lotistagni]